MANYQRSASFELSRRLLGMAPVLPSQEIPLTGTALLCPVCQVPMTVIDRLTPAQIAWRFLRHVSWIRRSRTQNHCPLDVPPHAHADVCSQALYRLQSESGPTPLLQHLDRNAHTLPLRPSFSVPDVPRPVTTSTRIPVLSPWPTASAADTTGFLLVSLSKVP